MTNKIAIASVVLVGVLVIAYSVLQGIIAGGETSMLGEAWVIGMSVVVLGGVLVWLRMPETTVKPAPYAAKKATKKSVRKTSKKRK
jgi:hypothetical protein